MPIIISYSKCHAVCKDVFRRIDPDLRMLISEFLIQIAVQNAEHGFITHIVTVDYGYRICHIFVIVCIFRIDRSRKTFFSFNGMIQIVIIFSLTLHDRIINFGIINMNPCIDIRVLFF